MWNKYIFFAKKANFSARQLLYAIFELENAANKILASNQIVADFGEHAFVRADLGRNAFDAACGVKTGTGAFVGTTAVADVATFALLLVVI